jgi:hypothetical protein
LGQASRGGFLANPRKRVILVKRSHQHRNDHLRSKRAAIHTSTARPEKPADETFRWTTPLPPIDTSPPNVANTILAFSSTDF